MFSLCRRYKDEHDIDADDDQEPRYRARNPGYVLDPREPRSQGQGPIDEHPGAPRLQGQGPSDKSPGAPRLQGQGPSDENPGAPRLQGQGARYGDPEETRSHIYNRDRSRFGRGWESSGRERELNDESQRDGGHSRREYEDRQGSSHRRRRSSSEDPGKYLWSSWSEEWVVLYDDSTMAWFKDASGKCMATQKHLVKEYPEMLAISTWTGQIPRRPALPPGARLSQLMALGSRQSPGHVVWMLAKNDEEMKEWMNAISKTLPPPPHIELVMSMPYLRTAFKKPTVRVRPATSSEMYNRYGRNASGALDSRGLVAVIKRQVPLAGQLGHELAWGQGWGWVTLPNGVWSGRDEVRLAGQFGHELAWGQGWGWVTLPNGVWSGRLTWSQDGDDFALHAMPIMHHTNVSQACSMLDGVTAYEASAYEQALSEYDDSGTSDDWDMGVDCGDFMM